MYIHLSTFFKATFPGWSHISLDSNPKKQKSIDTFFLENYPSSLSLLLLAHYENMLKGVVERETISSGWFIICMYAKTTPCVY